jgi:hypothetical protein
MDVVDNHVASAAEARVKPFARVAPGRVVLGALVWLAVTVAATVAVLGVNYAAALVSREPIRAHISEAVESGAVVLPYRDLEMNVRVGPHQFNDCLILNMITDERGSNLERSLSPIHGFSGGGSPCDALANPPTGTADPLEDNYHRYMHGTAAVDTFLTAAFGIGMVRNIFAFSLMLASAGLAVAGLGLGARALGREDRGNALKGGMLGLTGLCYALFFGLGSYGYSLAHPPTDLTLLAYLWVALLVDFRKLSMPAWVGLHALFGVLIMWFELLHGGIPLSIGAALIAWSAYAWGSDARAMMWRGLVSAVVFFAAATAAFVMKVLVTVVVFGPEILGSFSESLSERMGVASPVAMVQAILANAHYVGAGSRPLGIVLIAAAVVGVVLSALAWRKRLAARTADGWAAAVLLGGAALVILGWCVVFLPHTTLHAFFMVRIFVGLIAASALLAIVTWREKLAALMVRAGGMIGAKA